MESGSTTKRLLSLANAIDRLVIRCLFSSVLILILSLSQTATATEPTGKRILAEWERQEATWLQWRGPYERIYEPTFAQMAGIVSRYQKLHILVNSSDIKSRAIKTIEAAGYSAENARIEWHQIPVNSAWMRDNGPVYNVENDELKIQNWDFDARGGAFGKAIPFEDDNLVPTKVAKIPDIRVDHVVIVHERGNFEINGVDTVLLNWSTPGDPARNSNYSCAQAEKDLKHHFGVSRVVMVEGIPSGDLTRSHIDGFAGFINADTVVVSQCTQNSQCSPGDGADGFVYDIAAKLISDAGSNVIRDPIPGQVRYRADNYDTNYLNPLVGNGFVITVGFGDEALDAAAKKVLRVIFPDETSMLLKC